MLTAASILRLAFATCAVTASAPALAQLCPANATGSCTAPHSTPGCGDQACCELVCAFDGFCCLANWDAYCAYVIAPALCTAPPPVPCGQASSGPCDQVHANPSCADAVCCEFVCTALPSCCTVGWDAACVNLASTGCGIQCDPPCPSGATSEIELCSAQTNAACVDGVPNGSLQVGTNGTDICGKIQWVGEGLADTDSYSFTVTDPNGDGLAKVTLAFSAKAPAFVALSQNPCASLSESPLHAQVSACLSHTVSACLAPGVWYATVARGTFPTPESFGESCGAFQRYSLQLSWNDQCTNPCGGSGDCYAARLEPGCGNPDCCATVCASDPLCCEKAWDQLCVDAALVMCSPTPPANDHCDAPRPLGLGIFPFTLAGATASPQPAPAGCLVLGGTTLGADAWFSLDDVEGAITISTCGSYGMDSVLLVYEGSCGSAAIACGDDNSQCPSNGSSSVVSFTAQCDANYLVRVASPSGPAGAGQLTIASDQPACPACVPDLNGDRTVDGLDLSVVLSGWGAAGQGDIDGSGAVDGIDLTAILSGWGACP